MVSKMLVLLVVVKMALAIDWQDAHDTRWALHCDFFGNDLADEAVPGEQCGSRCEANGGCSHFTWTDHNGGTCWMKRGNINEGQARDKGDQGAVCGFLKSRAGGGGPPISHGGSVTAKGTYWADQTDAGGCAMPTADYAVHHALALGQSGDLGNLVWRQGLCGQVLNVQCGGESVDAVVASTCNLGSGSCGVDMIRKTWNAATGGKQPGIASCTVRLTSVNPIQGGSPQCYIRPNSGPSEYYTSLAIFNTGGRVAQSASVAGVAGQFQSGSGYFDFNANGQPKFGGGAGVEFRFEDGSTNSFSLSDCRNGGNTHIWS